MEVNPPELEYKIWLDAGQLYKERISSFIDSRSCYSNLGRLPENIAEDVLILMSDALKEISN